MYYGLTNYYQNHRRYVKSRDDDQLLGRLDNPPSTDCAPFDKDSNGKPIAPCGAIANSLFSDELTLRANDGNPVPTIRTGIAWPSDRNIKFKNPPGDLQTALADFVKPLNWKKDLWQLDPTDANNNGFQNEDLIVWMRTAALPSFRKLYRKIDHSKSGYSDGLIKGNYTLTVDYCKYSHVFFRDLHLTTTNLPLSLLCHRIRRREKVYPFNDLPPRWQKPFSGSRLYSCRLYLPPTGLCLAIYTHQV